MINLFDEVKDTFWWAACTLGFHSWVICYSARGRTTYKCCRWGCEARKHLIEDQSE